jgi:hypothetical protein
MYSKNKAVGLLLGAFLLIFVILIPQSMAGQSSSGMATENIRGT